MAQKGPGDQEALSSVHLTMNVGGTGQNQNFQPMTLTTTHQALQTKRDRLEFILPWLWVEPAKTKIFDQ